MIVSIVVVLLLAWKFRDVEVVPLMDCAFGCRLECKYC